MIYRCPTCNQTALTSVRWLEAWCPHGQHDGRRPARMILVAADAQLQESDAPSCENEISHRGEPRPLKTNRGSAQTPRRSRR